jgi:apolipoprotein N-acyltransferase
MFSKKGSIVKNLIPQLGLLLLSILLLILSGCLLLFLTNDLNSLAALGIGVIILFVLLTFLCYLLFDLYGSIKADQGNGRSSS